MDKRLVWVVVVLAGAFFACTKEAPTAEPWNPSNLGYLSTSCPAGVSVTGDCAVTPTPTQPWYTRSTHLPEETVPSPTPDPPRIVPTIRLEPDQYTVQSGDSLASIGFRYNVSWEIIAKANQITDPNSVSIGQDLLIPAPTPSGKAPANKIIPDSELVYGPNSILFDPGAFIAEKGGYLSTYSEDIDLVNSSGVDILNRVSTEFSVHPRILLAVLEYSSGWVTQSTIDELHKIYPLGYINERYNGLYKQLSYAASNLNKGFYLYQVNGIGAFLLADGTRVPLDGTINAGTAGVQQLMASLYPLMEWEKAVSPDGIGSTFEQLFGYPFDYAIEPLLPPAIEQPLLQLPFETEKTWSFTSGPHSGWGDGSAWAALDFAPPGEPRGCVLSDDWVTAVADGSIVVSGSGIVVQDLDGDGFLQTGWSVLYLHIDSSDRVKQGQYLYAGDRIGHPSCEGGISNGTHLHIARRYNGMWISADGKIPFILDGWTSSGNGTEYDGNLKRDGITIEAYNGVQDTNQIQK